MYFLFWSGPFCYYRWKKRAERFSNHGLNNISHFTLQEPKKKYFDVVKEHRSWCPWSRGSQQIRKQDTHLQADATVSPIGQTMSPDRTAVPLVPGWQKVLEMLLPKLSPQKSLLEEARTVSNSITVLQAFLS